VLGESRDMDTPHATIRSPRIRPNSPFHRIAPFECARPSACKTRALMRRDARPWCAIPHPCPRPKHRNASLVAFAHREAERPWQCAVQD
jgi:hypothetical protein